ncbi:MAG: hypothetical protein KC729_19955, partial [Candidatus Eisenbacteria bacterium]|nr:hypothetical protein [Candidatus Eisenbacteria bacterium]
DFDLLLWHGTTLASRFIQFGTGSWCSHVSLVMREPASGMVLNFESTTESKTPDWFTRRPRSGSQVNALSERLSRYPGRVYVRRFAGSRTEEQRARLRELRRQSSGLAYERKWLEWLGAGTVLISNHEDREYLFCSELVAWVLGECGIITRTRSSNEYAPKHFTTDCGPAQGGINTYLYLSEKELLWRPRLRHRSVPC